jgi:Xaa-Pro aminopeptidase
MFPSQTYINRRNFLKSKIKSGIALFLANEEVGMNYRDNTYHFRQDSNFLYFFGIDQPNLMALIDFESGEEYIFGNELSIDDVIWTGPQPSLQSMAESVGIQTVKTPEKLWSMLSVAIEKAQKVHYLPPYRAVNAQKIARLLGISLAEITSNASESLVKAIVSIRSIKTSEEIVEMEEAVNISRLMHLAAMKHTKPNRYEYEVVGQIHAAALANNGQLSYPIIYSVNGQTLHNHSHQNLMQKGQLALCDFGAENKMHYAGDITRTLPVSGKFNQKQTEIYNLVLKMYEDSMQIIQAGIQYKTVHLKAASILLDGLKDLGMLKGDTQEMLHAGVQGLFMPHGLGHQIGLDVHDMEDLGEKYVGYREGIERSTQLGLRSLRLAKELESGFVLTVEPGIYFIPELIEKWKKEGINKDFINFEALKKYENFGGVRIEDDVLVEENGCRILGNPIPKTIQEVEVMMEG